MSTTFHGRLLDSCSEERRHEVISALDYFEQSTERLRLKNGSTFKEAINAIAREEHNKCAHIMVHVGELFDDGFHDLMERTGYKEKVLERHPPIPTSSEVNDQEYAEEVVSIWKQGFFDALRKAVTDQPGYVHVVEPEHCWLQRIYPLNHTNAHFYASPKKGLMLPDELIETIGRAKLSKETHIRIHGASYGEAPSDFALQLQAAFDGIYLPSHSHEDQAERKKNVLWNAMKNAGLSDSNMRIGILMNCADVLPDHLTESMRDENTRVLPEEIPELASWLPQKKYQKKD